MLAIIGSGLSGAAVAREADRRGADYTLLEAGPDLGSDHVADAVESARLMSPANDPSFDAFVAGSAYPYGPTAGYRKRVGGRGLYWRGICLRIEAEALSCWPGQVRQALEEGLYDAVVEELADWSGRTCLSESRSGDEQRLVERVATAGYPAIPTPRAVRFRSSGRWSAYSPIAALPAERITPGFLVTGIEPRRRGGFVLRNSMTGGSVEADSVVLAAGLFENAHLTAQLVPSAGRLRIVDHLAAGFVVFQAGLSHGPLDASVFAGHHRSARSNLFVESEAVDGGVLLDAWAMGEQPPESASVLDGGSARVALERSAQQALLAVGDEQRRLLAELAEALGVGVPRGVDLGFDEAVARALADPGRPVGYVEGLGELDHESSGLPLGGDLVDSTGQMRAVPGVHVVGPCLFPRAGAANPSLTTLALARYVAAAIM